MHCSLVTASSAELSLTLAVWCFTVWGKCGSEECWQCTFIPPDLVRKWCRQLSHCRTSEQVCENFILALSNARWWHLLVCLLIIYVEIDQQEQVCVTSQGMKLKTDLPIQVSASILRTFAVNMIWGLKGESFPPGFYFFGELTNPERYASWLGQLYAWEPQPWPSCPFRHRHSSLGGARMIIRNERASHKNFILLLNS